MIGGNLVRRSHHVPGRIKMQRGSIKVDGMGWSPAVSWWKGIMHGIGDFDG